MLINNLLYFAPQIQEFKVGVAYTDTDRGQRERI